MEVEEGRQVSRRGGGRHRPARGPHPGGELPGGDAARGVGCGGGGRGPPGGGPGAPRQCGPARDASPDAGKIPQPQRGVAPTRILWAMVLRVWVAVVLAVLLCSACAGGGSRKEASG